MATFLEAVGGFSGTVVGVNKRRCVISSSLSSCQMNRITSSMSMPKVISDDCFKGFISGGNAVLPLYRGLRMCLPRKPVEAATTSHSSRSVSKETVSEAQETITAAGVVNQTTFQKLVLDSDIPVLVDFWAPWCGPCRMIAPLIDELARQYAGKLKCLKLNTDDSPDIATEYGIRSIPTVMIFVAGEKKDTVIGAVPKSTLTTTIEKYLDW